MNRRIVEYRLIGDDNRFSVTEDVNELIEAGWQPLGSASCSLQENSHSRYLLYTQAMVRYEERGEHGTITED